MVVYPVDASKLRCSSNPVSPLFGSVQVIFICELETADAESDEGAARLPLVPESSLLPPPAQLGFPALDMLEIVNKEAEMRPMIRCLELFLDVAGRSLRSDMVFEKNPVSKELEAEIVL